MPQLDFSLDILKEYRGISPVPSDIDDYWDEALKLLDNFFWDVELKEAEFQTDFAKCYDLTFTGMDGVRIYAKYLKPVKIYKPKPAIVQFHGYTGDSGAWSDKLKYVAAGFCVAAMDCRGQGGKSEDRFEGKGPSFAGQIVRGLENGKDSLAFKNIFLDCVQLARIVMDFEEVDENRVGVSGNSQGGALTLACASLEPRIKYAAAIHPFLSDYKRVWEMDLAKNAYDDLRYFFRKFDPLHEREEEIFETLGYIDIKNIVHRIKAKVLMAITLMDDICPPSTQFAAYNRILSEKDSAIYHDYAHEWLPGMDDRIYQFFSEML